MSIYLSTLSLHDALPICPGHGAASESLLRAAGGRLLPGRLRRGPLPDRLGALRLRRRDRKSTRLNSSHVAISYAVFCLKKKNLLTMDIYTSRESTRRSTY